MKERAYGRERQGLGEGETSPVLHCFCNRAEEIEGYSPFTINLRKAFMPKFDGQHLENARLLKASQTSAYVITLNEDHSLTERSPFGGDSWSGEWKLTEVGDLIIQIGPYRSLYLPKRTSHGGYMGEEDGITMMVWLLNEHHENILDSLKEGAQRGMRVLDRLDERVGLKKKVAAHSGRH